MTNNSVASSAASWRLIATSLLCYWIALVLILKTKRDEVKVVSSSSSSSSWKARRDEVSLAVITPTYHRVKDRNFQTHALLAIENTLCSTSSSRGRIVWILVESEEDWRNSALVEGYERGEERRAYCQHVIVKALRVKVKRTLGHRGVDQRNKALGFLLEQNVWEYKHNPVVIFADDDNSYTREHFERASMIRNIGIWPVGFPSTRCKFEAPIGIVQHSNPSSLKIVGFRSFWCGDLKYKPRVFNVDMAGFGVRLEMIGSVRFDENVRSGYLEDAFLRSVTHNFHKIKHNESENEVNASNLLDALEMTTADDILVWHLHHKVAPGKIPSARILTKVPKGDSFLCPMGSV
jgi:hypothetical protein